MLRPDDTTHGEARLLPSSDGTQFPHLDVDRRLVDVCEFFDEAVERWGDRTVWHFVDEGRETTYREAQTESDRIAAGLHELGVRAGDRVGIMLPNVSEFPLALLALARLGAISVPMNPKLTPREVDFIADDTDMSCLICERAVWAALRASGGSCSKLARDKVVLVGSGESQDGVAFEQIRRDASAAIPPHQPAAVRSLTTIQFTSGTTGLPKGCMLTHEYWVTIGRVAAALADSPQRILADYPFYYLQNQFYLMMAIAGGGRLVVTHGLSLSRFLGWLRDYEIDFAWVSPSLLRVPESDADTDHGLTRAPVDEMTESRHREFETRFGITTREWYGSTEAGFGTLVPWEDDDKVGSGSIGIAAPFRETKIIDQNLAEVEPGVVGELCLRGPGMMLGYHNRPEANAELFIADGWFRTGDLCRKEADGHHYFVGRLKDAIRRSGESISAQEVESVLMEMPGVADVAVIAVADPQRGEEVKAFLVPRAAGEGITPEAVLSWCLPRLARFKTPRYVEVCAELPYTSSGKIAKGVLKTALAGSHGTFHDLATVGEVER